MSLAPPLGLDAATLSRQLAETVIEAVSAVAGSGVGLEFKREVAKVFLATTVRLYLDAYGPLDTMALLGLAIDAVATSVPISGEGSEAVN